MAEVCETLDRPLLSADQVRAELRRRLHNVAPVPLQVGRVRLMADGCAVANVRTKSGRVVLTVTVDRRTGSVLDYT